MQTFEYMTAVWQYQEHWKGIKLINAAGMVDLFMIEGEDGDQLFMQIANDLAQQGWELCSVVATQPGPFYFNARAYFKRKIADATPD